MRTLLEICREVAEKIPGTREIPGGGIELTRRGIPVRVDFVPFGNDRVWTEFFADTGDAVRDSLRVRTAGFWHDVLNFFGKHDYLVGDAAFDAMFDIEAKERGFAETILGPSTRTLLRALSDQGGIFWRVSPAGFVLRLDARPRRALDLESWLGRMFQLLEAVPGLEAADRIRLGPARIVIDGDSVCPVCGAPLANGLLVRCAKCATPHHRDCWEFNRRCSTFACGESRFL